MRPLGYYHPIQIALEANATDQLTAGRYMLGVGHDFHGRQMEWRGRDPADTRSMVEASIEVILKLWSADAPVDYDGPYWTGKQMVLQCPPVQAPHPPVAIACITSLSSVELAAKLNLMMLNGDFIPASRLKKFGATLVARQAAHGHTPTRRNIRSTRVVYVAETDRKARDDMRESYQATIDWESVNTPHHQVERIPPGGALTDITFDYLVDTGNLFIGSPDTVQSLIEDHFEKTGGFGSLLIHAGGGAEHRPPRSGRRHGDGRCCRMTRASALGSAPRGKTFRRFDRVPLGAAIAEVTRDGREPRTGNVSFYNDLRRFLRDGIRQQILFDDAAACRHEFHAPLHHRSPRATRPRHSSDQTLHGGHGLVEQDADLRA